MIIYYKYCPKCDSNVDVSLFRTKRRNLKNKDGKIVTYSFLNYICLQCQHDAYKVYHANKKKVDDRFMSYLRKNKSTLSHETLTAPQQRLQ